MSPTRDTAGGDGGFTLIEVLVALSLLALAAAAVIPLLVMSFKTSVAAKLSTQAKSISQERVEQMRDLPFHVDRQNGQYLDLLDQYYPNLLPSGTPKVTGATRSEYIGVAAATGGEPAAPFYRVTIGTGGISGFPLLSQKIDVQFLSVDRVGLAPASTYDSQTEGVDLPPSLLVGVTVLSTWTAQGSTKTYRSFTEISDGRGLASTVTAQARVSVLKVDSTTTDGSTIAAQAGVINLDGAQSVGSTASIEARSATADLTPIAGSLLSTVRASGDGGVGTSPGTVSINTAPAAFVAGSPGCGFAAAGRGVIGPDFTPSTASGVPVVPSTAGTGAIPSTVASSSLMANAGGSCGVFRFGTATSSSVPLTSGSPLASVADPPGNAAILTGSAWLNGTSPAANPHLVRSGTSLTMVQSVDLFAAPFVTNNGPVVRVTVTSASLGCAASVPAGATATQTATGNYSARFDFWTPAGYQTTSFTWSSATQSGSADPLASINLATVVGVYLGTTYHLGDYISAPRSARSIAEGSTNGVHSLNGVISLGSATGAPPVALQVGVLSCVADDVR